MGNYTMPTRRIAIAMGILSWLTGAGRPARADQPRFDDVAALREYVMTMLRQQPGISNVLPDADDPAIIRAMIGDNEWRLDLTNIYGRLRAYPDEDISELVAGLLRLADPDRSREIREKDVVVVLRSKDYVEYIRQGGTNVRHEPLVGDLVMVYMADSPDAMSPLINDDMAEKSLTDLRAIALDNVRKWLPKVTVDDAFELGSLYYVEGNTLLSTSLVLLDEFWKSTADRFAHDVLIAVPRTDQLFIFDATRPNAAMAARAMIDITFQDGFNLLSDKIYERRNGKLSVVDER